jgi:ubiquitin C-terminal hydrolase
MSTYTEEDANFDKNERFVEAPSPQILYDLFGTNNHTGTLNQGHYIANVKVDNRWYQCNDSFISCLGETIEESDVTNSAYMLFYIRRDKVTDTEITR